MNAASTHPHVRILVIDDDRQTRQSVADELRRLFPGAESLAPVGRDGFLAALEAREFDVAVVDRHTRWSSGSRIVRAIKQRSPACRVIMFAATGDGEAAVHEMKSEVDDYVVKSAANLPRLVEAVRDAVSRRRRPGPARRRADVRMWEAEAKYEALVEQLPAVTFSVSLEGRALYVSPQVRPLLGFTPEELLGDPDLWRDRVHPEDLGRASADFGRLARGDRALHGEYRLAARDGREVWVSVHAVQVRDEAGNPLCFQGVGLDISGQRWMLNALHESNRRLQALSRRLADVREAEQRGIAAELHDRVGQSLSALSINLNIIRNQVSGEWPQILARLEDSRILVETMAETVRDVISELRPAVLDDYGLVAAVRWYGERFERRTGVATTVSGPDRRLPAGVEAALFRVVQEALTNVAKHAEARRAEVTLRSMRGGILLRIVDDGRGFARGSRSAGGGWGLAMARERAESVGARFSVVSQPGRGTRVAVAWRSRR